MLCLQNDLQSCALLLLRSWPSSYPHTPPGLDMQYPEDRSYNYLWVGVKGQAHIPCLLAKENPDTWLTSTSPHSPALQPSHSGHCQPPNIPSTHASPDSQLLPLVLPLSPIWYQCCWAQQPVGILWCPSLWVCRPQPSLCRARIASVCSVKQRHSCRTVLIPRSKERRPHHHTCFSLTQQ